MTTGGRGVATAGSASSATATWTVSQPEELVSSPEFGSKTHWFTKAPPVRWQAQHDVRGFVVAKEVPWFPSGLHKHVHEAAELRAGWGYIVLEEIVDGVALLMRWPWPFADERGRLFWPPDDDLEAREASIPVGLLSEQLYRANRVQRAPRVGDTFAVHPLDGAGWDSPEPVTDVRELFPEKVLDLSADARLAAKLAYEGSLVNPVQRAAVDAELVRAAATERGRLRPRELRTDQPPGGGGR